MYKVIIELKKDVSAEVLEQLREMIVSAFDNRLGKVSDAHEDSLFHFEFVGEENKFNCLQLGLLNLKDNKLFWDNADVWKWIDEEDPNENCDVKEEFAEYVRW